MNRDYTLKVVGLKDMSGGNGSPLEVQVSVVLTDVPEGVSTLKQVSELLGMHFVPRRGTVLSS